MTYTYRYVTVRGLERADMRQPSFSNPFYDGASIWKPVTGEDFLGMTWEELESVAHVIRDSTTISPEKSDFETLVGRFREQNG